MGSLKSYVAMAGMFAVAATTSAHSADLLPPPPLPEPPPIEIGGAWYLRGDVGVGILQSGRSRAYDASTPPAPYLYNKVQDRVSDQVLIGAGVGYQFNSWFRADVTGEYRTKSDWRFIAQDVTPGVSGNGYDLLSGQFSSVVGLVNGYFDIGHWYGFTPFIGAGVGVAHHMFSSVTDQGLGEYTGFGYGPAKDTTNLAWALHAGVGYDVSPNVKLELSYRYLNMGEARTGSVACLPACGLVTNYRVRDLESHDIRIGMRWMFDVPVALPEPEPIPLIRKY